MLKAEIGTQLYKFFQLDWDISKNKANEIDDEIRMRRRTLNVLKQNIVHDRESRNDSHEHQEHRNFSKKKPHEDGVVVDSSITPHKPKEEVELVESPSKNQ